jgi:hypothetical protein
VLARSEDLGAALAHELGSLGGQTLGDASQGGWITL